MAYAVEINEETPAKALERVSDEQGELFYRPLFLVNMETGEVKRAHKNEDGWLLTDTAFEKIGVATPDEYFKE